MAGFIDPGFEGQITLELTTNLPLAVPSGERIVQLI
jgi:deoxycytidine triphosphate deaminase